MEEQKSISTRQFMVITALFVIGDTIIYLPSAIALLAGQNAWLSTAVASLAGIILFMMYGVYAKRFPRVTLVEACKQVLGPLFGSVVGLFAVFFFYIDSCIVLWQVGDFMATHMMPDTPVQAFLIMFMLAVIMAVRLGITTVGRSAEIFFFWVMSVFLLLILLLSPDIEFKRLQPFTETGVKPVLQGALLVFGYYMEAFTLMMLLPVMKGSKAGKYLTTGMIIGGTVLSVTVLVCILVLGTDLTVNNIFITYIMSKKINIGNFLERIEVVMASVWFLTLFIKLFVLFYATLLGSAQLLGLKDPKPLSFPLAMLVIASTLVIVPNIVYLQQFILHTWSAYTASFGLLLPLVLMVGAARIKKRRR